MLPIPVVCGSSHVASAPEEHFRLPGCQVKWFLGALIISGKQRRAVIRAKSAASAVRLANSLGCRISTREISSHWNKHTAPLWRGATDEMKDTSKGEAIWAADGMNYSDKPMQRLA
jgi:hypothetical protein